jgi:hypothetical protein
MRRISISLAIFGAILLGAILFILFGRAVIVTAANRALAATPSETGELEIVLKDYEFTPKVIRVKAGQKVQIRLRNEGMHTHEFMVGRQVHIEDGVTEPPAPDFFEGVQVMVSGSGMPMGFEGMAGMQMEGMQMEGAQPEGMQMQEGEQMGEGMPAEGAQPEGMQMQEGEQMGEGMPAEGAQQEGMQMEGTQPEGMQMQEGEQMGESMPAEGAQQEGMQMEGTQPEGMQMQEGEQMGESMPAEGAQQEGMQMEGAQPEGMQMQEGEQMGESMPAEGAQQGDMSMEGMQMQEEGQMEEGARIVLEGAHAEGMEMEMDEHHGGMVMLDPGRETTLTMTIPEDKVGTWVFGCFQENGLHFDDGMRGLLIVEGN